MPKQNNIPFVDIHSGSVEISNYSYFFFGGIMIFNFTLLKLYNLILYLKNKFIIFYQINPFIIISQNKQSWTWNTFHPPETRTSFFIFRVECSFLRRNFLNCLRDKAARDQVPFMSCNNEHVIFPSLSSFTSTSNVPKTSNNSKTHNLSEKSSLNKKPSKTVLKNHNGSDYDRIHNLNLYSRIILF